MKIAAGAVRKRSLWLLAFAVAAAVMHVSTVGALASTQIVYVDEGVDVAEVAQSVGATPQQAFHRVARGFTADLSSSQLRRLLADDRVLDVEADAAFALMPFKRAPFKRAPFKRAPFKRADASSPYNVQVSPTGVQRINAFPSMIGGDVDADIAILDGGVDASHADLNVAGSISCVPGEGVNDLDGHGTMVAGLAAARNNGFGVVGVAPGARIWSVKVANANGVVMESAALCGLEWVLAHADQLDVANMSWAGEATAPVTGCDGVAVASADRSRRWRSQPRRLRNGGYPWRMSASWLRGYIIAHRHGGGGAGVDPVAADALGALVCQIHDAGVTLVAAAGNDSRDASRFLPAAWPSVMTISSMSDTDGLPGGRGPRGCMTHDRDDVMSSFTNFGAPITLAAPGECLVSTDINNDYAVGSGTSFAAPLAAGAVALLASRDASLTPDDIRTRLLADAEPGPIRGDHDRYHEGLLHLT